MKYECSLSIANPALRDHRVHGRHVLPGLACIDLVYHFFRKHGYDFRSLQLTEFSLRRPLIVDASRAAVLQFAATEDSPGTFRITLDSEIIEDGRARVRSHRYATAQASVLEPWRGGEIVDLSRVRASARRRLDLAAVYASYRERGVLHEGFMRAHGELLLTDDAIYVDCRVAESMTAGLMFHPALIDSAALCGANAVALFDERADDPLVLPLSFGPFRAAELLGERCVARIRRETVEQRGELRCFGLELFDPSGHKLAELGNFAGKAVRDLGAFGFDGEASASVGAARERSPSALVSLPRPVVASAPELEELLRGSLARRLGKPTAEIDATVGYYDLGVDSAALLDLASEIGATLGRELAPTLLFEYATVRDLAAHLAQTSRSTLSREATSEGEELREKVEVLEPAGCNQGRLHPEQDEPIAIIGMAGRFPGASNVREFWDNLKGAKDCVTEVPATRWRWERFMGLRSPSGKPISRWGGFIADADCFDAEFFRISPREAETMDPQERLFLETCWEALEDAGYTPADFERTGGTRNGRAVGVFVGVMHKDYALLASELHPNGTAGPVWQSNATVANRVSYFCNFCGPSIAVDTVCSSSLVAVHLAIQSIRRGECVAALAGGVNLSLHPFKYVTYGLMDMHSSDGRCRAFGMGGDGYVSSEAVGAVLLKPLRQALADGDHVYAVIRASSVNHVGSVSGFTVPSPVAQAELIAQCLAQCDVDARSVGYVEAHGTGTSLGDPIELQGLIKAYASHTSERQYCAIGSVKSNIGHAESAAGVCGLIKVALQLRDATLVPSLHADSPNPHVDLSETPFFVQRTLEPWVSADEHHPRRAGLSSFGASGTNTHLVLEQAPEHAAPAHAGPVLVPLSAKNRERLSALAARLLEFLRQGCGSAQLSEIAYTLQIGREPMDARVAFVSERFEELIAQLERFVLGSPSIAGCFLSTAVTSAAPVATLLSPDEVRSLTSSRARAKDLAGLARLWVSGVPVDWRALYSAEPPRRVSLPTYPFSKTRYWLAPNLEGSGRPAHVPAATAIHPLLHTNISDLYEIRFTSVFDGTEFFLADHRVGNRRVLPAAACLEMVREAVSRAWALDSRGSLEATADAEDVAVCLLEVVWSQPIVVDCTTMVSIVLTVLADGELSFEVSERPADQAWKTDHEDGTACMRGRARLGAVAAQSIDLVRLRSEATRPLSGLLLDDWFRRAELEYGPSFLVVQKLTLGVNASGETYALSELSLPECARQTRDEFLMHPALLDGALRSAIGLVLSPSGSESRAASPEARVPFALERLDVLGPIPEQCLAHVRRTPGGTQDATSDTFDVDVYDLEGRLRVRMQALAARRPEGPRNVSQSPLLLERSWEPAGLAGDSLLGRDGEGPRLSDGAEHYVIWDPALGFDATLAGALPGAMIRPFAVSSTRPEVCAAECGTQLMELVQGLLRDWPRRRVLIQVVLAQATAGGCLASLVGLLKCARIEQPELNFQVLELTATEPSESMARRLLAEARSGEDVLRYTDGLRYVERWRELAPTSAATVHGPWKDGGVYLVTGGAGGLGLIFADAILSSTRRAAVVLTGRAGVSSPAAVARITALKKKAAERGAIIEYRMMDVTEPRAVESCVRTIVETHGKLDGVLHAAGVIRDSLLVNKTRAELDAVLGPKLLGTINLDDATRELALDFFLLFASDSGVLGNVAQADYALANAFQDWFADHRERLVEEGLRRGRTLAIDWTLWAEGGMRMDAASESRFRRLGLKPLETADGVRALERAFSSGRSQVLVVVGDWRRAFAMHAPRPAPSDPSEASASASAQSKRSLEERTREHVRELVAQALKLPPERVGLDVPFAELGLDSVIALQVVNSLEEAFGALSKTLLFEYPTLAELAGYLLSERGSGVAALFRAGPAPENKAAPAPRPRRRTSRAASALRRVNGPLDIAVIGMSGRYPRARDLDQFWENLRTGADCVTEVPAERWDHQRYYDPDKDAPGKTYGKWGGFIDGVDRFDPLFFGISPREAEAMDPQARLFLQCAYETLEDAGYTRHLLGTATGLGRNVGVFVGVMYEEYQLFGAQAQAVGLGYALEGSPASIANRVSHFCNFHGPSLAVDTMCSSSLTSIHLACQSLVQGDCEVAIAGGVNVSIHPNKYLLLGQGRFMSSKGRCESFGQGGDGYVPAEGVGAVLLKPLAGAIADGDHIYGVVKAVAINHGGRANGYTVPNPNAQAEVIGKALRTARVHPRAITYIEAHGTGTSLGDPIEIAGLSKVFEASSSPPGSCAVGSVKSNIGHCESAAGIAALTKVLLQMKHGVLAPSLHSEQLNPHIDFQLTPFVVQRSLAEWKRPRLELSGAEREYPRTAGISSFGAGGANAHLIVQEYVPAPGVHKPGDQRRARAVVPLSAKTEDRLRLVAGRLRSFVRAGKVREDELIDLAYTLQLGREALEVRMVCWVSSLAELDRALSRYLDGELSPSCVCGTAISTDGGGLRFWTSEHDMRATLRRWVETDDFAELARLWVQGVEIDWNVLHEGARPHRVSLPTYPFAEERCWPKEVNDGLCSRDARERAGSRASAIEDRAFLSELIGLVRSGEIDVEVARARVERRLSS